MMNLYFGQNEVVAKAIIFRGFEFFVGGNLKVCSFCSLFRITGAIHNSQNLQDQGVRRKYKNLILIL